MSEHVFYLSVPVYYEDTDHSGRVYHANYLKFFERAREEAIGQAVLMHLWEEEGLGFVVYQLDVKYTEGAVFGDVLEIRSSFEMQGPYRMNWLQEAWRPNGTRPAVKATIQLVCVDRVGKLLPIPDIEFGPTG